MSEDLRDPAAPAEAVLDEPGAFEVFRNRPFLLLWLSQMFTQVGGNMVLFGMTIMENIRYGRLGA
ncbi:MAG: hypothetical protein WCK58_18095, partial [Chloroflexota bacterium]